MFEPYFAIITENCPTWNPDCGVDPLAQHTNGFLTQGEIVLVMTKSSHLKLADFYVLVLTEKYVCEIEIDAIRKIE